MPSSLISQHESGLFEECRNLMRSVSGSHRSEDFNRLLLPRCQPLVEAIGHRMAYEAAVRAEIRPELLALYEATTIQYDSSWYVQHAGLTREKQHDMEEKALSAVLPLLGDLIEGTAVEPYCTAPIVSGALWDDFIDRLEQFQGNTEFDVLSHKVTAVPKALSEFRLARSSNLFGKIRTIFRFGFF